jgi:glycosyltransferase involved in cell wall biosynthesis
MPFTFTAHAKDIFHETVRETDLRRKLQEAAAAVTVSEFNLAHLRQRFGADAEHVKRIYNGVDLDRLRFVPAGDRPPLVLAIGRLVQKKGFHVLLDACALLLKRGVAFRCMIAGSGEEEAALKAQHQRLGLDSRVELAGPRPQREVFELLQQAAVFAAPCVIGPDSNRDGLPTVLLEAMALGAPCISTAVTGIPEAVIDGQTGIIVPQHDPAALADAIEKLLSDSILRSRLAVQGRRLVEEQFEITRNAARLREVFEEACAPRGTRREAVLAAGENV